MTTKATKPKFKLPVANPEQDNVVLQVEPAVTLRGVAFLAGGFDNGGGMEGQARALAHGLAERGVPVTYITTAPAGSTKPLRETLGLINVFRIPIAAAVDWQTTLGLMELAAFGIVRSRLHRLNLIYAVHHETGAVASRIGETLGLPVAVKLSGAGHTGDATTVKNHPDSKRLLRALRRATRIVATTDELASEATEALGIPAARVVRLNNGVDLSRFKPRPWAASTSPQVLFLGRLSQEKRIDILLEAFARVRRERPSAVGLELRIAGEGPLRGELERQASALGISDSVRFLGEVEDVVKLLRDARVFVLSSSAEGSSNALLEALATGVPAVATRLPGTSEMVDHETHALLVPPLDVGALAAAISRLLDDDELCQRLSEAGRARCEERYDLGVVAARHVSLFSDLAVPRDEDPSAPRATNHSGDFALLRAMTGAGLRTTRDGIRSTVRLLFDQARRRLS